MAQFKDRATGMIHSTMTGPDGGMVHAAHSTLEESHAWGKSIVETQRQVTPPKYGTIDEWRHTDNQGNQVGHGVAHTTRSHYYPSQLPQSRGK